MAIIITNVMKYFELPPLHYCFISAFLANVGRPRLRFWPIGRLRAAWGTVARSNRMATPIKCLPILFLKNDGQLHFPVAAHFLSFLGIFTSYEQKF